MTSNNKSSMLLTEKEKNLMESIRALPYGQTHLIVFNENHIPVRIEIEQIKESVKL